MRVVVVCGRVVTMRVRVVAVFGLLERGTKVGRYFGGVCELKREPIVLGDIREQVVIFLKVVGLRVGRVVLLVRRVHDRDKERGVRAVRDGEDYLLRRGAD